MPSGKPEPFPIGWIPTDVSTSIVVRPSEVATNVRFRPLFPRFNPDNRQTLTGDIAQPLHVPNWLALAVSDNLDSSGLRSPQTQSKLQARRAMREV